MQLLGIAEWEGPPAVRRCATDAANVALEGGTDPAFGTVRWRTLVSADGTPSLYLTLGLAEFGSLGTLSRTATARRSSLPASTGPPPWPSTARRTRSGAGTAVFIPLEAEHGVVAGPKGLRFAYGFSIARFSEADTDIARG